MGTFSEAICKHRIVFPSIQHLAWLPQGRPQGNQNVVKITIFGLTHWLKHRITRKLLKIDRYMLRGVWQALNCLSIHGTYCVIVAGASPGETKMWAAVRENGDFFSTFTLHYITLHYITLHFLTLVSPGETSKYCVLYFYICTCGSNNWETVEDRWVHAARGLASTELSFHSSNVLRDYPRGVPRGNQNVVK